MFTFEICNILKNTYFDEHLRITASVATVNTTDFCIFTTKEIIQTISDLCSYFIPPENTWKLNFSIFRGDKVEALAKNGLTKGYVVNLLDSMSLKPKNVWNWLDDTV